MDFGLIFSFPSLLLLLAIAILSIYLVARLLPKPKIDIKGKNVLITGCDTGFGRATAIELDRMGVHVFATCLTNEGEKSLKSVTSDKLKTFQMDVTNSKRIKDVYEEIKKETSLDDFKRTADVNIWGMIDVTKTFLPLLKRSKGRVVNLSSSAGRIAGPLYGSYAVSKYGVEAFSDALRREMHPWGVKVSMLEPGFFATNIAAPDFLESELRRGWNRLSEDLKDDYGEEYLEKAINIVRNLPCFSDISEVVNAIVDGLTSTSPSDRYVVGPDAKYGLIPLSILPAFVGDFMIPFVFKPPCPQGCRK
ncbi:retinol dehydrogenase 7-like isoform X2 [Acropora palmata]|uniref:retinol dehydrogenase 7-like isoform X2 n=1 Tax=Acropora palmata TaxID=6131 RepID=UPI003DA09824